MLMYNSMQASEHARGETTEAPRNLSYIALKTLEALDAGIVESHVRVAAIMTLDSYCETAQ